MFTSTYPDYEYSRIPLEQIESLCKKINSRQRRMDEIQQAFSKNIEEQNNSNQINQGNPANNLAHRMISSESTNGIIDLNMNRTDSQIYLNKKPVDSFVIRKASSGGVALTFKTSEVKNSHFLIKREEDGKFICDFNLNKKEQFDCKADNIIEIYTELEKYLNRQKKSNFHGIIDLKMNRDASQSYLDIQPENSYVIRQSSQAKNYVLSYKMPNEKVFHFLITSSPENEYKLKFDFFNGDCFEFKANSLKKIQIKFEKFLECNSI